jgi:hypothetical protein
MTSAHASGEALDGRVSLLPAPTIHDPIHHVAHAFERDGENLWVHCWFEQFLTDAAQAARDGVFTAGGLPTNFRNAVWIAAFAQRHRHETVMTFPPPRCSESSCRCSPASLR